MDTPINPPTELRMEDVFQDELVCESCGEDLKFICIPDTYQCPEDGSEWKIKPTQDPESLLYHLEITPNPPASNQLNDL